MGSQIGSHHDWEIREVSLCRRVENCKHITSIHQSSPRIAQLCVRWVTYPESYMIDPENYMYPFQYCWESSNCDCEILWIPAGWWFHTFYFPLVSPNGWLADKQLASNRQVRLDIWRFIAQLRGSGRPTCGCTSTWKYAAVIHGNETGFQWSPKLANTVWYD